MMWAMTNDPERSVLVEVLASQRAFLRQTVEGITDEQATARTTVSELCLGGIVKHVTRCERRWARFPVEGPSVIGSFSPEAMAAHAASFRVEPGETLASLVADYEQAAIETEKVIWDLESLDVEQPLPEAPWFPPGARWSARRGFMHILAETAQHCGHADIIREALDGSKTMG